MKSRRITQAERSLSGRWKIHTRFWWRNLTKGVRLEDLDVDDVIILNQILNKEDGKA